MEGVRYSRFDDVAKEFRRERREHVEGRGGRRLKEGGGRTTVSSSYSGLLLKVS